MSKFSTPETHACVSGFVRPLLFKAPSIKQTQSRGKTLYVTLCVFEIVIKRHALSALPLPGTCCNFITMLSLHAHLDQSDCSLI